MQKLRAEKGITLIALVITIIVMLILVGVSVTVALNGGLFTTAKEAAEGIASKRNEELQLSEGKVQIDGEWYNSMEEYINETGGKTGEKWTQNGTNITNGIITLQIGDKVAYDETDGTPMAYETSESKGTYTSGESDDDYNYILTTGKYTISGVGENEVAAGDMTWRVLGINDNGQIELISEVPTTNTLTLYAKVGYNNAITELNTFCNNLYGQGKGAISARSLTAEDINKLGEYDPTTHSGYGIKYTYKYYDGSVYGIASTSITEENVDGVEGWTDTYWTEIRSPDWTIDSSYVGPEEVQSTQYYYKISDKITEKTRDNIDISTLITHGAGDLASNAQYGTTQFLASPNIWCDIYNLHCNIGVVRQLRLSDIALFDTNITLPPRYGIYATSAYVRPVVTLESGIQILDKNSDGIFELN